MESNQNNPVFPLIEPDQVHGGLTLREHYAGLIMAALITKNGENASARFAVLAANKLIKELNSST